MLPGLVRETEVVAMAEGPDFAARIRGPNAGLVESRTLESDCATTYRALMALGLAFTPRTGSG